MSYWQNLHRQEDHDNEEGARYQTDRDLYLHQPKQARKFEEERPRCEHDGAPNPGPHEKAGNLGDGCRCHPQDPMATRYNDKLINNARLWMDGKFPCQPDQNTEQRRTTIMRKHNQIRGVIELCVRPACSVCRMVSGWLSPRPHNGWQ